MHPQSLRAFLERVGRGTDVRLAGVVAVGHQDHVERLTRARKACRVADGRGDGRLLTFRLERAKEHLRVLPGERAGLGEKLRVLAAPCLSMAEGDQPEGGSACLADKGLFQLAAGDIELGGLAELVPHALRGSEDEYDRRTAGPRCGQGGILGGRRAGSEYASGQSQ